VTPHPVVQVVVVVVSIAARVVVAPGVVVVLLVGAPLTKVVRHAIVLQEHAAWLSVVPIATTSPTKEGEILDHIQMDVQLVVKVSVS